MRGFGTVYLSGYAKISTTEFIFYYSKKFQVPDVRKDHQYRVGLLDDLNIFGIISCKKMSKSGM